MSDGMVRVSYLELMQTPTPHIRHDLSGSLILS